jgi:hypothetical protein
MRKRLSELKAGREPLNYDEAMLQALQRLRTRDVVEFLLKRRVWDELSASEREAGTGRSLAQLVSMRPHTGKPRYFVSHAWGSSVIVLLAAVGSHLAAASDTTRVWLDFVALNQFDRSIGINILEDRIQACSGGTIVAVALKPASPAKRAWCVIEWERTLAVHGYEGLHLVVPPAERAQLLSQINITDATCSETKDKTAIINKVVTQYGSAEAFDASLKLQLLLEPLSYKVDLQQLRARSRGAQWQWGDVAAWLLSGKRVLCILGEAASGKCTVSAAMAPAFAGVLCALCHQPSVCDMHCGANASELSRHNLVHDISSISLCSALF